MSFQGRIEYLDNGVIRITRHNGSKREVTVSLDDDGYWDSDVWMPYEEDGCENWCGIISKYDGRCGICGDFLPAGSKVMWSRAYGIRHYASGKIGKACRKEA